MTKRLTFPLVNGRYIRKYDNRNWCICYELTKVGKGAKEVVESYHPTLMSAWRSGVDSAVLVAESKNDLVRIIQRLERVKHLVTDE